MRRLTWNEEQRVDNALELLKNRAAWESMAKAVGPLLKALGDDGFEKWVGENVGPYDSPEVIREAAIRKLQEVQGGKTNQT